MECLVNIGFFQMMTEEEYNERERMVEKVKSFFFLTENEVVSFLAFFTNPGGKKKMS